MTQIIKLISTSLLVVFITACQHPVEEVDSDISGNTITAQSHLADLIHNSTLKDGSFDNILDNASSVSVQLPVTVFANSNELTINTPDDFRLIENIYNEEPYVKDSIQLIFPIVLVNADYSEQIVDNQEQLDLIVAESVEGGDDPDIECYSYEYPIKLSLYDKLNQLAYTRTANSNQELHELFSRLEEQDIVQFSYPINIYDKVIGDPISIDDNSSLESLLNNGISACVEDDTPYYKDEDVYLPTTSLTVFLTDAPFPTDLIAEANISINQIRLKISSEDEEESDEEDFLILSEEEMQFNLLELTNGLTATLVNIQVPTGSYDEVRVIVTDASVLLNDGELFDLQIPGGSSSGIKVKINPTLEIVEGEDFELLLDFDVSQSFVVKGNPDTPAGIKGFNFKPVIKAADLSKSGSVSGEVLDMETTTGIEGVEISIFAADTLNTTTFTDENGEYKVLGLTAGDYDITAEHDDYETQSMNDIAVEVKEDTKVNFELTMN